MNNFFIIILLLYKYSHTFYAFCVRNKSITTIAAMLSMIGGARGRTQGSWRPLVYNVIGLPSNVCVYCGNPILETGLNATLK